MYILNKFIMNTVDFLNKFASTAEEVGTNWCVVCIHTHTGMCVFTHMPVCVYSHTCLYVCIHTHACMCVLTHLPVCVYVQMV